MTTVKSPFWRVWRSRDTLERRLQHNLSHENCLLFANVLICRRHHNRWHVQPTVIESHIKFIETIECLFTWVVNFTNSDYFDQTPGYYIILISIVNTHAKGSYIKTIFYFNLKLLNNVHYILIAPIPKPCYKRTLNGTIKGISS